MSYWVVGYSDTTPFDTRRAVSRSHASSLAAQMRRALWMRPWLTTIQIRPAAGSPVECWALSRGRWARL